MQNGAHLRVIALLLGTALFLPGCKPGYWLFLTGEQEDVLVPGEWGLDHTPDGHVSFFEADGIHHIWFTAGNEAHHFSANGLDDPTPWEVAGGESVPILGPSGQGFDGNYAGPGSVIRASNGQDLLMFYHAEDWVWDDPGGWPELRSSQTGRPARGRNTSRAVSTSLGSWETARR